MYSHYRVYIAVFTPDILSSQLRKLNLEALIGKVRCQTAILSPLGAWISEGPLHSTGGWFHDLQWLPKHSLGNCYHMTKNSNCVQAITSCTKHEPILFHILKSPRCFLFVLMGLQRITPYLWSFCETPVSKAFFF